ncbi:hypothetical protein IV203_014723 [Nitzschia inconspicua]|uniref:Uncharacterized protein n=1 Tax=Nitzschia inconspicua TaxID=303405 RepID=A0A9K3PSU2_9STRA|nr:hypothetical protein IV203_014723 [Nitzschia inconspicua]
MSARKRKAAVKYAELSSSGSEKEEEQDEESDFDGSNDHADSSPGIGGGASVNDNNDDNDDDDDEGDNKDTQSNSSDDTHELMKSLQERFIDKKKKPLNASKMVKSKPVAVKKESTKQSKTKARTVPPPNSTPDSAPSSSTKKQKTLSSTTKPGSSPIKTAQAKRIDERPVVDTKYDSMDVFLPSHLVGIGGDNKDTDNATATAPPGFCSVLIQVQPDDAKGLDFEGVSGAIGRFEVGTANNSLVLDLKGCQYHASILPGPTAMIVGFASKVGNSTGNATPQLRVDGITDEFATLVKTNDSMSKLDAKVQGDYDKHSSFGVVEDDNVNRAASANTTKKDK